MTADTPTPSATALKPLGDIPNVDGYAFTGVRHDGVEIACVVCRSGSAASTYYVAFAGNGEPCFSQLKGWIADGQVSAPSATAPAGQVYTPTPWEIRREREGNLIVVRVTEQGFEQVVFDTDGNFGMKTDDAAHIVHCVNTHSQLLALLREWFDASDPSIGGTPDSLLERTRAALKLVTP